MRKGQNIFNFLEWLNTDKGFELDDNIQIADPFYIEDREFDKLWKEFEDELGIKLNK